MEFLEIMHYVRSLGFEQEPDYDFIIGQIEKCAKRLKISLKVPDFCWNRCKKIEKNFDLTDKRRDEKV